MPLVRVLAPPMTGVQIRMSRVSYCYFAPGDLKNWRSELPYFAGRVIFAGEHTAEVEYCGYMEGAIRSGQRAADQILAFQE
jgi:monoamine oxidase